MGEFSDCNGGLVRVCLHDRATFTDRTNSPVLDALREIELGSSVNQVRSIANTRPEAMAKDMTTSGYPCGLGDLAIDEV